MADRFTARFNGVTEWAKLTPEQQTRIGAAALENAVAVAGVNAARDQDEVRPYEVALDVTEAVLIDAVAEAISEASDESGALPPVPSLLGPVCRRCGCSDSDGCGDGCSWAEPDLCTACLAPAMARREFREDAAHG